jgi:hypothetical protein
MEGSGPLLWLFSFYFLVPMSESGPFHIFKNNIISLSLLLSILAHPSLRAICYLTKGYWILPKAFSAYIEMIMCFCPWYCLYVVHLLICMCWTILAEMDGSHSFIPGMNLTWSWYMIFIMFCWLANILLRIFCVYVHQGNWYIILFFVVTLPDFSIKIIFVVFLLLLFYGIAWGAPSLKVW